MKKNNQTKKIKTLLNLSEFEMGKLIESFSFSQLIHWWIVCL